MGNLGDLKNIQIVILGLCIAGATITSTVILSKGVIKVKRLTEEVITVTGSAEKGIVSDYTTWKSEISRRDSQMTVAFEKLATDIQKVKNYLLSKGIKDDEIIVSQISTSVFYKKDKKGNNTNDIEGYSLRQQIEVRSYDVPKVDEIARRSTELINKDIHFISGTPEYFYTRLSDLKVQMLAEATENAKLRAESMARSTGNKIGFMRSAKMGVFQITPINSYKVSWYGNNDTSSFEKKVTAVVNVAFSIEE